MWGCILLCVCVGGGGGGMLMLKACGRTLFLACCLCAAGRGSGGAARVQFGGHARGEFALERQYSRGLSWAQQRGERTL